MKKILLICIIFITCGCSAKYEINFIDEKIYESTTVKTIRNNVSDEDVKERYSKSFYALGRETFYNFDNSKSNNNEVIINYNYEFNTENITSSNMIKSCIEHFDFFEENNKYFLIASGSFRCSYYEYVNLDSLDIVIYTNHNVLEHNADEIKNNKYIWHINLKNIDNVSIKFITDNKINSKIKQREYKQLFIFGGITLGIGVVLAGFIIIKHKQVNKI